MNKSNNNRVCPVERAGMLDSSIRRLLQNPRKLLDPYIKKSMTVLDLGCGPGFFSIEMAKLLNDSGKVISADLQQGMLEIIQQKINGTDLERRIELHKCREDSIGVTEKVDFVLAFYMIHEVPNQSKLFSELLSILKPKGKILIIEPKIHVSKEIFGRMVNQLKEIGFKVIASPKVFFSHAVVLSN